MKSGKLRALVTAVARPHGFTLVEVVVSMSILTVASGLIGSTVFQVLSTQQTWRENAAATKELGNAGRWFSNDARRAESTDLTDGGAPANSVALTWADADGVPQTATYGLSGDQLVRNFDGEQATVARGVDSTSYSLAGGLLVFDLVVQVRPGSTKSRSVQTYLRMLK